MTTGRSFKAWAVPATFVMVGVSLVGCGPPFTSNISPVDFGLIDSHVALAFCSPETVLSVRLEQRPAGRTSIDDWQDVWRGEGTLHVSQGEVLVLSDGSGLTGEILESVDRRAGTKFTIYITVVSTYSGSEEVTYQPSFTAPAGGLQDHQWIDSYGVVTDAPCD